MLASSTLPQTWSFHVVVRTSHGREMYQNVKRAYLHFTLIISATYKFVYICTAYENCIFLTRTSKAAMSKSEFTAKEGNLFHGLIALGKKLNLKILVLAKGTLTVFIMHVAGMS